MTQQRLLRDRGEEGSVILLFAGTVVIVMIFAALVVDLANGRQERRHVQNGVDAAGLGAAKVYDGSTNDGTGVNAIAAKTLALELLVGNGFDVPKVASAANSYSCHGEQDCDVRFAFDNSNASRLCVDVRMDDFRLETFFAGIMGHDHLFASAHGNGCRRRTALPPEQTPAFFSAADNCDPGKAFNFSGSNVTVTGTLHSNRDMVVSGSDDGYNGLLTYRTTFTNSGSGNTFVPLPQLNPTLQPFPLTFAIAAYRPGGARAVAAGAAYHGVGSAKLDRALLQSNGWLTGSALQPGIYHTAGEMDLDLAGVTAPTGGVTFVAEQKAVLKWANGNPTPYEPSGLFVFANNLKVSPLSDNANCSPEGLIVSGQNFRWRGLLYVPRSGVDVSASDVAAPIEGAILAHALLVQGQNFTLNSDPTLFAGAVEEIFLDA